MDIARVMDACRELAVSHSIVARDCDDTYEFHRAFLGQVKKYGRVWELGLIKDYKLRTGHLFQDILVAPLMFLKAKIHLLPKRIRGRKEVRRIFKNCT